LTGPAGVGKTRLALAAAAQVANQFLEGVTLVDLSPIRDPLLVLPTIARALGFSGFGNRPLPDRLHDYLRQRSILLVLDNFEQVLPAASVLADLLSSCPELALLVTSRVPLRLRWEWTLRVAPLPVPDLSTPLPPLDALVEIPAVALFVARARARQSDFALTAAQAPLVARLTSELDGLPLALELAAARLDVLSLSTITRRLGDWLRLLRWEAADVPERQQSLEAAVGWSYDLLSVPEQRLFRCLGAFAGRVALDAITAVEAAVAASKNGENGQADTISETSQRAEMKSADGTDGAGTRNQVDHAVDHGHVLERLASLAEKSLVLPARQARQQGHDADEDGVTEAEDDEDSELAFAMLETVREYAWEQLAAEGELEAACGAHAYYFLALAERADPHLRDRDQRVWYRRLEQEQANLRAALRWLLDQENDRDDRTGPDAGAEIVAGREAALRLASALAWFWWTRGYLIEGRHWLEEALRRAPQADPAVRIRALLGAGPMLAYQGAFGAATTVLEEARALARERQQPAEIARILAYLGLCALYAGDVAASVPALREALRRGRAFDDPYFLGLTLLFLGAAAFAQGHDEQAASLYAESLARFEAAEDALWAANLHVNLGWFASRRGDLPSAVGHIHIGLEASMAFQDRRLLGAGAQMALSLLGDTRKPADLAGRARLLGAVDALSQATGMTLLQTLLKSSLAGLRDQLKRAGLEAMYREGNALPFQATARLALTLLESIHQTMTRPEHRREPVQEVAHEQHNPLSPRQKDVLRLVAQGLTNKAIGRHLFLSASTVNYHLTSAFNNLGAGTRAQAVAVATQRGLL
ncbi:MAG: LuxR C-terminal-related transcriptional regulator, partial [Ktedonobacterales bacterium]